MSIDKTKQIIAIIGLMGAGKTTLGFKLARKLGYYFIDSDREIEDFEKKTITEIFTEKGEEYFRDIEKKVILDIISRNEKIVLSLGGGAFINTEIRQALQEKAITIWLSASIDTILQRVNRRNTRPLLQNQDKRAILEDLIAKRQPIYSLADIQINTDNTTQKISINKILNILHPKHL